MSQCKFQLHIFINLYTSILAIKLEQYESVLLQLHCISKMRKIWKNCLRIDSIATQYDVTKYFACCLPVVVEFPQAVEFLQTVDDNISRELINRCADLAYLSDIFDKLNEVNLKLQGKQVHLYQSEKCCDEFMNKLILYDVQRCIKRMN